MSTLAIIAIIAAVLWAAVVVLALALCAAAARGDRLSRPCPPAGPRRRGEAG
jgi:hypothetical protein